MANNKDLANGLVGAALTSAATTLVLQAGYGDSMPTAPFFLTITPAGQLSTKGNSEIVNVIARTGDTLTIERAKKGTTAKPFSVGDVVSNGIYVDGTFDTLDVAGDIYSNGRNLSINNDYSLAEKSTGVKWVDGKTVYQKVISIPYSGGTVSHLHGIPIDNFVSAAMSLSGEALPIFNPVHLGHSVGAWATKTAVNVRSGADAPKSGTVVAVLTYTKTI